ncbi:MAG: hypothetical protein QNK37_02230 [Acidobacteriota bacterium]|nr:hypothetical protein [Acidobacteriota bacterium]
MSGSVYAEQTHSAHLQGQQAANERAARLRQERMRHENAAVKQMVEAGKAEVKDREDRQDGQAHDNPEEDEDAVMHREGSPEDDSELGNSEEEVRHIDLTV